MRRDQRLTVENSDNRLTNAFRSGQEIVIPLKNADGGYIADEQTLDRIEGEGLVAFRYAGVTRTGRCATLAGVTNEAGKRGRPHAAPRARHRSRLRPRHRSRHAQRSPTDSTSSPSAIAAVARVAA